eukprot:EG_transcript_12352
MQALSLENGEDDDLSNRCRSARMGFSPRRPFSARQPSDMSSLVTLPLDVTFDAGVSIAAELDQEYCAMYDKYIALEETCISLQKDIRELQAETESIAERYDQRGTTIQAMQRNARWYEARATTLDVEADELNQKYTQLWDSSNKKLGKAREELKEKDASLLTLQHSLPLKRCELEATTVQVDVARRKLAAALKKFNAAHAELVEIRQGLQESTSQRKEFTQQAEEMWAALEGTLAQLRAVEAELRAVEDVSEQRTTEAALELLKAQVQEREARLASLKQELACERNVTQKELDVAHSLLMATCVAHGVVPAGAQQPVASVVAAVDEWLGRQAGDVAELLVLCDRLLAERERPP